MDKLFSIGDVAKLFHLSVSSLRHYENVGLITPEYTDPDSGYRYYGARQFEVLNTIRYLRALDMPLAEIADFLGNRDVCRMEEKLLYQKRKVIEKQNELRRKVGVGITPENLQNGCFDRYDGIFLILDDEDRFDGETTELAETVCATVRFRGSHAEAPAQYQKLLTYIAANELDICGFSREITMIDYGLTNDTDKFVTEIAVPVKHIARERI